MKEFRSLQVTATSIEEIPEVVEALRQIGVIAIVEPTTDGKGLAVERLGFIQSLPSPHQNPKVVQRRGDVRASVGTDTTQKIKSLQEERLRFIEASKVDKEQAQVVEGPGDIGMIGREDPTTDIEGVAEMPLGIVIALHGIEKDTEFVDDIGHKFRLLRAMAMRYCKSVPEQRLGAGVISLQTTGSGQLMQGRSILDTPIPVRFSAKIESGLKNHRGFIEEPHAHLHLPDDMHEFALRFRLSGQFTLDPFPSTLQQIPSGDIPSPTEAPGLGPHEEVLQERHDPFRPVAFALDLPCLTRYTGTLAGHGESEPGDREEEGGSRGDTDDMTANELSGAIPERVPARKDGESGQEATKVLGQSLHRGVAARRIFVHGLHDDRVEVAGEVASKAIGRRRSYRRDRLGIRRSGIVPSQDVAGGRG